ncbi:retinol dehydrogenase 11-like, partial [Penaeus indicus]|uniref:retinol dehydrogenase 11-like n=1 Tax=Penaeus indicus TaxID=29960 RepID=UPI00300D8C83
MSDHVSNQQLLWEPHRVLLTQSEVVNTGYTDTCFASQRRILPTRLPPPMPAQVAVVDCFRGNSLACTAVHACLIVLVRRILAGGICTSARRLDGKTVVITGCSVGIGRETARDLSSRGAKIIMACRDTKAAEKVAKEIGRQTGGELAVMKLDLASLASVRAFAEELKARVRRVHILINNA